MSSGAAAAQRPTGFTLLALVLAWFAALGTGDVLFVPPAEWRRSMTLVALKLLSIVLAAIGAEALWKVRPWANRVALSLATVAWVYALAAQAFDAGAAAGLLMYAAVLWLLVRYVDTQIHQRYGPAVILRQRRRVPWRP